ncbi:MAG: protein kinase, partial [Chloroflexota bacterium]
NQREYLVMDYVEGEDLNSMLQRYMAPLPEESVLNWADQVLDALAYLHNQRPQPIIHRDIKPANLRVNLQDKVKLVDFGLVKLLDTRNPQTKLELRGLGTPAYAPLEQFASSDDHTDTRTDIYALGATLYHLVTNLYPPDVHQRLLDPSILPAPRLLAPHISENTEQAILKAMAIYPGERYQSAAEMRQALAGRDSVAAQPVTRRPANVPVSLWVFGLVGLVLVLIILGAVALFAFGGLNRDQPPPPPGQTVLVVVATSTEPVQSLSDAPTATSTPLVETIAAAPSPATPTDPLPAATSTPTPTVTVGRATAQSLTLPGASLAGTIAYPVYNGVDFDLYFGQADGSGTRLFRKSASQPAFSPDGTRLAFHSWRLDAWGLMNTTLSGDDEKLVARFVEDQLPTWSADGQEILFLSRREGDRKSRLMKVGSVQVGSDGAVLGEGEYPSVGQTGQLVFRGWGGTGNGLRLSSTSLAGIQSVTGHDDDTAPALSPDGSKVAFMSRRDGNWEIYVVNADGSDLLRLTEDPAQDGLPAWSPDGRVIAFISSRNGAWAIWAMTPSGQGQRQLFPTEGSPDGFVGANRDASRGWAEERISWTK